MRILLSITNKIQRYTIFFIAVNALHVSGGFPAHHQELINCTHSIWYMSSLLAATASMGELAVPTHPLTQRHIPVDLNPQQYHCKNLRPHTSSQLFWFFNDRTVRLSYWLYLSSILQWLNSKAKDMDCITCSNFVAASNVIMMPCYHFFIVMLEFNDLNLHITQWKFILNGWFHASIVFVNKHEYIT